MNLLTDGLLIAATLFAGGYCWVLAGRVRDLKSLDKGLGASIVQLTRQVELARQTLETSRTDAEQQRVDLARLVERADAASHQLRVLIAASRDADRSAPQAESAARAQAPLRSGAGVPSPAPDVDSAPENATEPAPRDRPRRVADFGVAVNLPDVPKPRQLPPLNAPLRLFTNENPPKKHAQDEMDILEALRAIAGGEA